MAATTFLVCLLLIASGASAAGDDEGSRELPHLQLPGTLDEGRGHGSDAPPLQGLMDMMSMSGCGSFAALVAATPIVRDVFQQCLVAGGGGLTLFCPDDKAVAAFEPKFGALSDCERLDVLLHHAADARYDRAPLGAFDWVAVRTLAVADAAQTLLVSDRGDNMKVRLRRTWPRDGLGLATVTNTVSSSEAPLILHVVDAVLLQQTLDGGDDTAACGGHPWIFFFIIPICSCQLGRIVAYLLLAEEHGGKGKLAMAAAFLLGLMLMASSRATTAGDNNGASELPHIQLPAGTPDLGRGHAGSDAPSPPGKPMDIMSTSGCGRFAALVAATPNVSDIFQEHLDAGGGGLMVFCPDDKAVAAFEPTFRGLADSERLDLLLHHAAGARYVREQLAAFDWVAVRTLAVAEAAQTALVRDSGDSMQLWLGPTWPRDGLGLASVTNAVSSEESEAPLIVHVVDAVLRQQKLDGGGFPSWQELRCCIIPFCAGICVVVLIGIVGHLFWPEYDISGRKVAWMRIMH